MTDNKNSYEYDNDPVKFLEDIIYRAIVLFCVGAVLGAAYLGFKAVTYLGEVIRCEKGITF